MRSRRRRGQAKAISKPRFATSVQFISGAIPESPAFAEDSWIADGQSLVLGKPNAKEQR